jgi:hypothetical protein
MGVWAGDLLLRFEVLLVTGSAWMDLCESESGSREAGLVVRHEESLVVGTWFMRPKASETGASRSWGLAALQRSDSWLRSCRYIDLDARTW